MATSSFFLCKARQTDDLVCLGELSGGHYREVIRNFTKEEETIAEKSSII
jgi:hypothetical protein